MVTVRRRRGKTGDWEYQVWPSNLPANAPEPHWQPGANVPDSLAGPIAGLRLKDDAFKPLPYDDLEEAEMSQEEWDNFSFSTPEDEAASERAHPDWATWS